MRLLVLLSAFLAAGAGWLIGLQDVNRALANQGVSIHVYSGSLYGASYLTCGWHERCYGSANYERGLDFATSTVYPDKNGYFTGWGFSGDSQDTVRATGTVGHDTPFMGCTSTSVDVRDTFGAIQVRLYYVHVQQNNFGTFDIWAKQFGLGGHWNGDIYVGNQIIQSSCGANAKHSHTWYDGMAGVINILPRDYWWNCPNSSGFYFPCFNINPYQLPHDLNIVPQIYAPGNQYNWPTQASGYYWFLQAWPVGGPYFSNDCDANNAFAAYIGQYPLYDFDWQVPDRSC